MYVKRWNVYSTVYSDCFLENKDCQHSVFSSTEVIHFSDVLPAHQWNAAVFFYDHAMQFIWRMLRCTPHTLWMYVPFPDAEESTVLNDEQAASASLPIKKLIVCPSWRGNDPLGFSRTSLATQIQRLLTLVCVLLQLVSVSSHFHSTNV